MKKLQKFQEENKQLENLECIWGGQLKTCWTHVVCSGCTNDPCGNSDDENHMTNDGESK